MIGNGKEKENKNTSETDSYEVYKGEGEEMEASELEMSNSEKSIFQEVCQPQNISPSISGEAALTEKSEELKRRRLREKWFTITGRKPRNIPIVRKFTEDVKHVAFFGDQRPADVEEKIRAEMLMRYRTTVSRGIVHGKVLQEVRLTILSRHITSTRFLEDSNYFVVCSRGGEVQVVRYETCEVVLNLDTIERKHSITSRAAIYAPFNTNMLFVAGDAGIVQVFDLTTGECIAVSEKFSGINNMDFSSAKTYLGAVGKRGGVYFFDPTTLQVISSRSWTWESVTTTPGLEDSYHKLMIYALKSHPDQNNIFVTAGVDGTLKVWDVRTVAAVRSIRGPSVHGDGVDMFDNQILTASWRVDNSLNLWDFSTGRLVKDIPIRTKSTVFDGEFLFTCKIIKNYSPNPAVNNKLVAVGGSGFSDALIINMNTNEVVSYFPSFKPISCMDISDKLFIYGGTESIIRVAEMDLKKWKTM